MSPNHIIRTKMTQHIKFILIALIALPLIESCQSKKDSIDKEDDNIKVAIAQPAKFNSDSAYSYLKQQLTFGPRVPGTEGNAACREYIVSELKRHGASNVNIQTGEVTPFTGEKIQIGNIMGSYSPEKKDRVLLLAHYDTRPWADNDQTEENRFQPVLGANDGASGVAVLLEIARQLGETEAPVGVDLLFVDAEDYGQQSGFSTHDSTWCLGTQYWVENMPYDSDSLPRFAILLDMVGGLGAQFHREYFSDEEAADIVNKVWAIAEKSGYADRFPNQKGGAVVDDHLFINRAGIPAIDIIESKNSNTGTFAPTWHTVNDNLDHIDRSSLKAAGQTVLNVLHNEEPSKKA